VPTQAGRNYEAAASPRRLQNDRRCGDGDRCDAAGRKTKFFYITTAIAYPNGNPHIGHAYEAIATDALARFQRLDGKDVFLPDRHRRARVEDDPDRAGRGLSTSELAHPQCSRFKAMDERLNVSFDRFIRTTETAAPSLQPGDLAAHG